MFNREEPAKIIFTPKTAFIGGLVGGALVLCTIGFFVLLVMTLRGSGLGLKPGGAVNQPLAVAPSPTPTNPTAPTAVDVRNVNTKDEPILGQANAPVTIAYWRDFQCPFCQQFEQATLPAIIDQYVKSGKVKIIFKDFAFLGPDSTTVAVASRAVWEVAPAKWYEWQKMVFDKQGAENSGWGTKEKILALTKTISGINVSKVELLMTSKQAQYQQQMDADKTEGSSMGVSGTPGFITGTQLITGAESISTFQQAIDGQLKK